jgi:hypothetical protein
VVLWLDEMGVGSDAAAGRSWAPVGQTPVIKGTGKRFRVNMISAINPYVIPYALGVRTPGLAGRAHRCWSVPLMGGGAATPQGALRAIDSPARLRLLADLRPAPPAAAV